MVCGSSEVRTIVIKFSDPLSKKGVICVQHERGKTGK